MNSTPPTEQKDSARIELERMRLDLDRTRIELDRRQIEIEQQRLEMDRRALDESRNTKQRRIFAREHLGTFITTVVALATVVVSLTQIWVANIAKATELEITKQQQEREWRYKGLEFVTKNADALFGNDNERRRHLANALAVAFPPELAASLLDNLKQTSDTMAAHDTYVLTENKMHGHNPLIRGRK